MEERKEDKVFINKKIAMGSDSGVVNLRDLIVQKETSKREERPASKEVKPSGAKMKNSVGKSINILDRIIEFGIYLLVFLMPVFVLSFSAGTYELDKTFLLTIFSGALLLLWMINSAFVKKRFVIAKSKITVPFFALILIMAISGFLGVDKISSFLGYYGNFSDSVLFFFDLFVFYFIATSLMAERGASRIISGIVDSTLFSSLAVTLLILSRYLDMNIFFYSEAAQVSSTVSADGIILAIYLVGIIFVAFYDFFSSRRYAALKKIIDSAVILSSIFTLLLIGWSLVWVVLFALVLIAVVSGMMSSEKKSYDTGSKILLASFLLAMAIILASSLNFGYRDEQQLLLGDSSISSYLQEITATSGVAPVESPMANEIAVQSFQSEPLLGSGVGTYYYDFLKYKKADFNYDDNWTLRSNKAYNEFLEKVSTTGVLGTVAYVIMMLAAGYVAFGAVRKQKRNAFLLAAILSLFIFQFAYADSAVLKFLLAVLLIVISGKKFISDGEITNKISDADALVLNVSGDGGKKGVLSFFSLVALLVSLALPAYAIQSYRADAKYREVSGNFARAEISDLEDIVALNPLARWQLNRAEYESGVSLMYIAKLNEKIASTDLNSADEAALEEIQGITDKAISHAKRAVELSPNNVNFWENYAYVYKRIYEEGMVGADEWAVVGIKNAINLDPNNAILHTELGKVYMLQYEFLSKKEELTALSSEEQEFKKTALSQAEESFERAVGLKGNYSEAIVELANVYFEKGDTDECLNRLDIAKQKQLTMQTAIRIGKIYYNLGEGEKAVEILEAVNSFDPSNANTHYILGMAYKDQERYSEALSEFRAALRIGKEKGAA
ncbi:MAG: tetratricopeptide repeat protein, partial [Candidatus Pacebacteria bacterium]|nr:tetratricopeptide repeat protein [Candidatus Paceibacterota bacterium]